MQCGCEQTMTAVVSSCFAPTYLMSRSTLIPATIAQVDILSSTLTTNPGRATRDSKTRCSVIVYKITSQINLLQVICFLNLTVTERSSKTLVIHEMSFNSLHDKFLLIMMHVRKVIKGLPISFEETNIVRFPCPFLETDAGKAAPIFHSVLNCFHRGTF